MELNNLRIRLNKDVSILEKVEKIVDNITANVDSFTYANEPLEDLEMYLVLKNTGGYRMFKTIRGHIVIDKLDTSYSESRELVCISGWNIRKIYKISFSSFKNAEVREIDAKTMHEVLFSLIEPSHIRYVLGVEESHSPITITVDCNAYKGLSYKEYKDAILSSYKHNLEKHGETTTLASEPSYCVVSYMLES